MSVELLGFGLKGYVVVVWIEGIVDVRLCAVQVWCYVLCRDMYACACAQVRCFYMRGVGIVMGFGWVVMGVMCL